MKAVRSSAWFIRLSALMICVLLFWAIGEIQFYRKVKCIHFYKEKIDVRAGDKELEVHATYYYRNLTGIDIDLPATAPFPVNSYLSFPHHVSLVQGDGIPVLWERAGNTIRFCMFFSPREIKKMTLTYTQKLDNHKGSYILTTTKSWHRPLCRGDYSLEIPQDCSIVNSTYPLTRTVSSEGCGTVRITHFFSMENFMPMKDWDFACQPDNEDKEE